MSLQHIYGHFYGWKFCPGCVLLAEVCRHSASSVVVPWVVMVSFVVLSVVMVNVVTHTAVFKQIAGGKKKPAVATAVALPALTSWEVRQQQQQNLDSVLFFCDAKSNDVHSHCHYRWRFTNKLFSWPRLRLDPKPNLGSFLWGTTSVHSSWHWGYCGHWRLNSRPLTELLPDWGFK